MKKLLAILLSVAVMFSVTVISAVAEDVTIQVWDGETFTQPQGSGTSETDPYLVSTPAELAWMVNSAGGGKYFKLTNDIYVNDVTKENWTETAKPWFVKATNWMSYKNSSGTDKTFSGHIDGNGYTVYGIYCDGSVGTVNNALIPIMTGGSIKRLCVSDAVCNSRFSGGIVGTLYGSVTITDCVVKNSTLINTSSSNGDRASGAIVGYASHAGKTSNISGCATFDNTYSTATTQNGGILGNLWQATVTVESSYTDYAKTYGGTNSTFTPINSCALDGATVDTLKADSYFQNCAKNFIMLDGFDMPVSKGFANVETNVWNGFYQKPVAGEDGVYLITCPEEFAWMVWSYGGGASYKLTTDIYLNDISVANWQNGKNLNGWFTGVWNVGYAAKSSNGGYFTGTIDGDGHVVYGLYNVNDNKLGGLIPECKAATVKNLGLSDSVIVAKGAGYAGGIIGFINGANVLAENCFVEKTTIASGNGFDGAIVGYTMDATNLTVKNCYTNIGKYLVDYVHKSTTVTMSDSYVIDGLPYPIDQTLGTTNNTNVYTNQKCTFEGVTVLATSEMQGKNAFVKMNGLGNDSWYAVDNGSPMLRTRGTLIGDVNENGIGGEFADVTALRVVLINNTAYSNGDNNRDGAVDICDLVKMASAFAIADMEEVIKNYGSYYGVEMKLISDEIDALGEETVNYIFVSDLHFTNTNSAQDKAVLNQLEAIAKMANTDDSIDFVVVGGDLTSGGFSTKEGAIKANNNALAPLKNCTKPVFVLAGNHDDNCYHVYSGDKVYKKELILSDMDWNTKVLSVNSPENIVHDVNYENSKYYYYDLPEKKTRVVCLDAIDYRAPFDENGNITEMLPADFENNTYFGTTTTSRQYKSGASYWDYSAEQLRWLTEQALTKEDYNYIFVSHMGIDSETNSGGETTNAGYRNKLRNVIAAYQNKTTYADGDHTADFTGFSGKILSYSFGHIHVELAHYSSDIDLWQISTSSATIPGTQSLTELASSSINNRSLDWNPYYRALDTDSEACFDVISATPDAIYKFNVGTGADKKMAY